MTIALSLKVNDGVVLAADSASTVLTRTEAGDRAVVNIYNHANKVFNLYKGLPIGALTWGAGSIGNASIATLAKDLRRRLSGPKSTKWALNRDEYHVEAVAQRVKDFFYDEKYQEMRDEWQDDKQNHLPELGFIVAGYSADVGMAEEYRIVIRDGECVGPTSIRDRDTELGVTWNGNGEAISRLLNGYGQAVPRLLNETLEVEESQLQQLVSSLRRNQRANLVVPAMPIQDAIELAEFLIDTTIRFYRFSPGASTVKKPIELAAITKHEGFKWVQRKHYYPPELNPDPVESG